MSGMATAPAASMVETILLEAVARRARADLVLKPVTPKGQPRLISQFLLLRREGELVLAMPQSAANDKVFVPVGWQMGVGFEVGGYWHQGLTELIDHWQAPVHPCLRSDAIVIRAPAELISRPARSAGRITADPSKLIFVAMWLIAEAIEGRLAAFELGRVVDQSDGGMGLRLEREPRLAVSQAVAIVTHSAGQHNAWIGKGTVRHISPCGDGQWVTGLGDVRELAPGEFPALSEYLARGHVSLTDQPRSDVGRGSA